MTKYVQVQWLEEFPFFCRRTLLLCAQSIASLIRYNKKKFSRSLLATLSEPGLCSIERLHWTLVLDLKLLLHPLCACCMPLAGRLPSSPRLWKLIDGLKVTVESRADPRGICVELVSFRISVNQWGRKGITAPWFCFLISYFRCAFCSLAYSLTLSSCFAQNCVYMCIWMRLCVSMVVMWMCVCVISWVASFMTAYLQQRFSRASVFPSDHLY